MGESVRTERGSLVRWMVSGSKWGELSSLRPGGRGRAHVRPSARALLHPPPSPLPPSPNPERPDPGMSVPLPSPMLSQAEAVKELVQLGETSQQDGVSAKVNDWVADLGKLVSLIAFFPPAACLLVRSERGSHIALGGGCGPAMRHRMLWEAGGRAKLSSMVGRAPCSGSAVAA